MRIIKPSVEYIPQEEVLDGIYKKIEKCARTCYKSEDKITEDSAKPFVERMIKSNHLAMLEQGTVYLKVQSVAEKDMDKIVARHKCWTLDAVRDHLRTNPTYDKYGRKNWWAEEASHIAKRILVKYSDNPYSKATAAIAERMNGNFISRFNVAYITTNLRVLQENGWLDDLKYICEPTEFHEKRYTFKIITDRSVSHELVRHRVFSFAMESQRYCCYFDGMNAGELTFIEPTWLGKLASGSQEHNPKTGYSDMFTVEDWKECMQEAELNYHAAIIAGLKPQEARSILPNATKTELCMTGYLDDWKHFLDLRYREITGKAHPDCKAIATMIHDKLVELTGGEV